MKSVAGKTLPWGALFLVLVTLAVYGRMVGHGFITTWDDSSYILENPAVRGFSFEHLRQVFTTFYVGNYAPLQIVSYMADYTLWGMKPAGFAVTNILLHALNGLLLRTILLRMGWKEGGATAAAFVFLCHPVQVESVAWFSQRKNLLAMTFFLAAFLDYLRFASPGGSPAAYWRSVGLFALSLLTKAVVVVFPLILVVHDLCEGQNRDNGKNGYLRYLPYVALATVMTVVTLESQEPIHSGGRTGYHGGSLWTTLLTMIPVMTRYVGMVFRPAGLSASYAPPVRFAPDATVILAALLLAALAGCGVLLWRRQRRLFFWYAAFWIGFIPVLQLVPIGTLMNDRYFYFPLFGGAPFLVGLFLLVAQRLPLRFHAAAVACGLALLAPLPVLATLRTAVWHDSLTLWQDAVRKEPRSVTAWNHLGVTLSESRGLDASLEAFSSAVRVGGAGENGTADAWNNMAAAYSAQNRETEAVAAYKKVLEITPNHLDCLANLGLFYLSRNDLPNASVYIQRLVLQNPAYGKGYELLAELAMAHNRMDEAEQHLRRALSLGQRSSVVFKNLGLICLAGRRPDEARSAFRSALELEPGNPDIHFQLARVEALAGKNDEVRSQLERALALGLDPGVAARTPELSSLGGMAR